MRNRYISKETIDRGLRVAAIVGLSACTAIHPGTISQSLGPAERDKFESDYAECHQAAESQRPQLSLRDDIGVPLSAAFLLTIIGVMVEYPSPIIANHHHDIHSDYGGKALIAFSTAGVALASTIVASRMMSRQRTVDAAMRSCLYKRGYSVDE